MTDDKKQIEEMATVIFKRGVALDGVDFAFGLKGSDHFDRIAKALYSVGCRIIPEGAVVLTREEYEKLGLVVETIQEYGTENGQIVLLKERKTVKKQTDFSELLNQETKMLQIAQARKETAREVICKVIQYADLINEHTMTVYTKRLKEIAKQYGVEVDDERI